MAAHLAALRTCLPIAAFALACLPLDEGVPGDTESIPQPINGTVTFPDSSCSGLETKIQEAMSRAANHLGSPQMVDCMQQAVLSYNDHNWAEEVLAIMGQNMPTQVTCGMLITEDALAQAETGISHEALKFSPTFVRDADIAFITTVILHEVGHNKGWIHPNQVNARPELDNIVTREYAHAVLEQMRACSAGISNGASPAMPNGHRRDGFAHEAHLGPVGRHGGGAFEVTCPGRTLAMGVPIRSGVKLDAIGLDCRAPGTDPATRTGMAGGSGGSFQALQCFGGEVLVGLRGRASDTLLAVGPICAPESEVRIRGGFVFDDPIVGGGGGVDFRRQCPLGMAVRGIKGRSGSLVDRIELECQDFNRLEVLQEEFLQLQGNTVGMGSYEKCAGRSAMVGLTYHFSNRVDRLGGLCEQVATASGTDRVFGGTVNMMAAHGGTGGLVAEERCPLGSVLVGLDIRMGAEVDAVAGRCAPSAGWSNGQTATTSLTMRGGNGGSLVTRMCPLGEFLIGWRIHTGARVNAVSPVCRNFR